jgi:hypothetical protein
MGGLIAQQGDDEERGILFGWLALHRDPLAANCAVSDQTVSTQHLDHV